MSTIQPRFTLKIISPSTVREIMFDSLLGLRNWIDSARAKGEIGDEEKLRVYDEQGEL